MTSRDEVRAQRAQKRAWSVPEFAAAVGVSQTFVRQQIAAGRIQAKRLNPDLSLRSKHLITTTPDEYLESLPEA